MRTGVGLGALVALAATGIPLSGGVSRPLHWLHVVAGCVLLGGAIAAIVAAPGASSGAPWCSAAPPPWCWRGS